MAVYLGLSTSSLQGFVGVDIPCKDFLKRRRFQAFAINSHFVSHAEKHAAEFGR